MSEATPNKRARPARHAHAQVIKPRRTFPGGRTGVIIASSSAGGLVAVGTITLLIVRAVRRRRRAANAKRAAAPAPTLPQGVSDAVAPAVQARVQAPSPDVWTDAASKGSTADWQDTSDDASVRAATRPPPRFAAPASTPPACRLDDRGGPAGMQSPGWAAEAACQAGRRCTHPTNPGAASLQDLIPASSKLDQARAAAAATATADVGRAALDQDV
jgi:hypothetical protein